MATKDYVGARYVPKFADPVEWSANTAYEGLTIVSYNGASYTSKKPVPATVGNPGENSDYWACTGNYNGQVEIYRQETASVKNSLDKINEKIDFIISGDEGDDITEELQTKLNSGSVMLDGKNYVISAPITITAHTSLFGSGSELSYKGSNPTGYMIVYNYTGGDVYDKRGAISDLILNCSGVINGVNYVNARNITARGVKVYNPYSVGFHLEKNCGAIYDDCSVMQQAFSSTGTAYRNKITGFDSHLGTDSIYTNCVTLFTYIGFYLGAADNCRACHPLGLTNLDNSDVIDDGSIAFKVGGDNVYIDHGYSDECAIGVQSDSPRSGLNINSFYDFFYTAENTATEKRVFSLEVEDYSQKNWYLRLVIDGVYYQHDRSDVIGYYWPNGGTLWLPFLQNAYINFKQGNQFLDRWTKNGDLSTIPWFNRGTAEEMGFDTTGSKYATICQLFDTDNRPAFENAYGWIGFDMETNAFSLKGVSLMVNNDNTVIVFDKGTIGSNGTGATVSLSKISYNGKQYLALSGGYDWTTLGLLYLKGWGCKLIGPGRLAEDEVTVLQSDIITWNV